MLKFNIGLWLVFFTPLLLQPVHSQQKNPAESIDKATGSPTSEGVGTTNDGNPYDPDANLNQIEPPSFWGYITRLMGALLLVAACLFLMYVALRKWSLKSQAHSQAHSMFKVVGRYVLAPNRQLCLVQILNEFYLLGVGTEQIQCLDKIQNKEDIDRLRLEAGRQNAKPNQLFNQWLSQRTGQSFPSVLDVTKGLRRRLKKP